MQEYLHNSELSVQALLALVFLLALLESLLVVGLLIPGVALLSALTLLAAEQHVPVAGWWLAGALGALCGDGISFHLGRVLSHRLVGWRIFRQHPQWLPQAHRFFHRHGGLSIASGRFIGPLRPLVPAVAGAAGMPPLHFWWVNVLSSAAWAAAYLLPVYWLGQTLQQWLPGWVLMVILLLISVLALLVSRFAVRR